MSTAKSLFTGTIFVTGFECNPVVMIMILLRKTLNIPRLLTAALIIAAAVHGSAPAPVKAAPEPIDLQLNGSGYTPIIVNNIKPGDSGVKTVELRNAGTRNGLVSIWLSDVVNREGMIPESETGDTGEPGELDAHLRFELKVDGLNTSLTFPAAVRDLPKSATDQRFIEVIPLKAGETKTLDWLWELPSGTGNEVQGDELSFSINYFLREIAITDISGIITPGGRIGEDVTIYSENRHGNIRISADTTATTTGNTTLSAIWLVETDNIPPPPPAGRKIVGLYYDAGPDGTVFDEPLTITLSYIRELLPAGASELGLYIGLWDKTALQWVALPGSTVDTAAGTVSARITHFSRYTVLSPVPPSNPQPAVPPDILPGETVPEEKGTEKPEPTTLEVNLLDEESLVEIGEDGTLEKTLVLSDLKGNFVMEIQAGSKITGAGGARLGRIELEIVELDLLLPDNTVVTSPVYKLTGYTPDHEITDFIIEPAALLKIKYNPGDLPEYSFLPFVATYSGEKGLIVLGAPAKYTVEIGWAKALIAGGGYYLVAAETAPLPPALPASFTSSNLVITPAEVFEGEPVQISVTITNEGAAAGSYEVYLIIDGIVRAIQGVTLNARSSETLTFEVTNLSAGTHQVRIAGLTGSIRVNRVVAEPVGPGVNWPVLDLGVSAAVAAGLIAWYLFLRRARRREKIPLKSE